MPPQTTKGVPQEKLSSKLDEDWLPSNPIKIEMIRETKTAPHKWTVVRHYE